MARLTRDVAGSADRNWCEQRQTADTKVSGQRQRLRAGDPEAFAELYDELAARVVNHAHRLTGDWALAEDVMSETFLVAWRSRAALDPDGESVAGWLLAIATNQALNVVRGDRRRLAFLASRAAPLPVEDLAESVVGRLDDARRLRRVREAVKLLRRSEVEVLALCVWEGLDQAQAAQALGVPVTTVRSRLSRARARLRSLSEEPIPAQHDPVTHSTGETR